MDSDDANGGAADARAVSGVVAARSGPGARDSEEARCGDAGGKVENEAWWPRARGFGCDDAIWHTGCPGEAFGSAVGSNGAVWYPCDDTADPVDVGGHDTKDANDGAEDAFNGGEDAVIDGTMDEVDSCGYGREDANDGTEDAFHGERDAVVYGVDGERQ